MGKKQQIMKNVIASKKQKKFAEKGASSSVKKQPDIIETPQRRSERGK